MECFWIFLHERFDLIDVISSDRVELVVELRNEIHYYRCCERETAFLTSAMKRWENTKFELHLNGFISSGWAFVAMTEESLLRSWLIDSHETTRNWIRLSKELFAVESSSKLFQLGKCFRSDADRNFQKFIIWEALFSHNTLVELYCDVIVQTNSCFNRKAQLLNRKAS